MEPDGDGGRGSGEDAERAELALVVVGSNLLALAFGEEARRLAAALRPSLRAEVCPGDRRRRKALAAPRRRSSSRVPVIINDN